MKIMVGIKIDKIYLICFLTYNSERKDMSICDAHIFTSISYIRQIKKFRVHIQTRLRPMKKFFRKKTK